MEKKLVFWTRKRRSVKLLISIDIYNVLKQKGFINYHSGIGGDNIRPTDELSQILTIDEIPKGEIFKPEHFKLRLHNGQIQYLVSDSLGQIFPPEPYLQPPPPPASFDLPQ